MEELFLTSCAEGSTVTCNKLIRKSVNVNHADINGQTGLMKACQNNHYDIAKFLLQSGVNVNQVDRYGQNALHYAVKAKNEKLVKLLLNQENLDAKQKTKITFLTPKDYCLTATNTKQENEDVEPVLYDILLKFETRGIIPELSDIESDEEKTGGDVYKKDKKKKRKGKNRKRKKENQRKRNNFYYLNIYCVH